MELIHSHIFPKKLCCFILCQRQHFIPGITILVHLGKTYHAIRKGINLRLCIYDSKRFIDRLIFYHVCKFLRQFSCLFHVIELVIVIHNQISLIIRKDRCPMLHAVDKVLCLLYGRQFR